VDIGFVVHVHVFNVHRGSIASRDHLKADLDISQSSLWFLLVGHLYYVASLPSDIIAFDARIGGVRLVILVFSQKYL